ncbi:MAG: hypothetical protein IT373_07910, partial [Polyangiaceae bacterium]|nr:hypothetical protein [Polyangiaceae bacterium]
GLFSPLTPAVTNFELVQSLGPAAVVLVVPDRIGCFHDLIACLRAAGGALDPLLVVFTAAPPSDLSTGQNMPELQVLGYDGPVWSFPAGEPNDAAFREVADQLIAAIAAPREAVTEE